MRLFLPAALLVCLASCASSTPSGEPDAPPPPPIDAPVFDAEVHDAEPDAEPCVPDPDGEVCNGEDDDCDGDTDEGYPGVGEPCQVGVGACVVAGGTVCTPDGANTECDADAGAPGTELCGTNVDEDCDGTVDEGYPTVGTPCSVGSGACFATGVHVCSATGLTVVCDATAGDPQVETCDGSDEDCDGLVDEGFQINQPCDGGLDSDLCAEGVWACDAAGGRVCTDMTGSTYDLCGGGDEDCDPTSGDGSEDGNVGTSCDGADSDLCSEGVQQCVAGALVCSDHTGSTIDMCGGGDEDCDDGSADGSEDPMLSAPCDGADSDLCVEGVRVCTEGALVCNDASASSLDLCGNGDEDCDPTSLDGSEDPGLGVACDGGDSDLCVEGARVCTDGALVCNDATPSTLDLCGGGDEDCDAGSADGSEDPMLSAPCDGADSDLCVEGVRVCTEGALVCNDASASSLDLCGNGDEDCDPTSLDGSEDPGLGVACDGADSDLCVEGARVCTDGALVCNDATPSTLDVCGGGDEDCDAASPDGSEDPMLSTPCDGADSDLCVEGVRACADGALVCTDTSASTLDLCGNGDEDCDPASADGSEDPALDSACDGVDSDLCLEGVRVCTDGALSCNDTTSSTLDQCGGGDEDCDAASPDGSEDPALDTACDGPDSDLCTEGVRACSDGALVCTDATGSALDLCGGGDEDCDPASADGSEDPAVNTGCDGADSDLCVEGVQACTNGALVCTDTTGSTLDLCGGGDEDCDAASADGSEDPLLNTGCDGADSDLCVEGVRACTGGALVCTDATSSTLDLCGGGDQDCDPSSGDGSEDPALNSACDGADSDLCLEGVKVCSGGSLVCTDSTGSTIDMCGGGDEDCDGASPDGSEDPLLSSPCDGGDTDLCVEGVRVCSAGSLVCNDSTGSTVDTCGGGDQDCDSSSPDGSEDPQVGQLCDGPDSDFCLEGSKACQSGSLVCSDNTTSTSEVCAGDAGDEDCDGTADDGFPWGPENPACPSSQVNLGEVSGDENADHLARSYYNAEWHKLRIREDSNSSVYVSARISLYSPPGVDYDLYVYCFSCGGSLAASSANANMSGHTETVDIRADDDFGQDDSHDVLIYVAYRNANRCANWQLDVSGNLSAPSQNCNP